LHLRTAARTTLAAAKSARTAAACVIAVALAFPGALAASPKTSAECGDCHKDIYRMWSGSAHARSMEGAVFLEAYRATEEREGEAVSRTCLRCHAPLSDINKDRELSQKVTWEGVNCDVCHGLASVEMTPSGPRQTFQIGDVKRGPIQDAASGAHEVAYSELHTTSLVCAGCHEFVNGEGTPILTTYSEWENSRAAESGKNCQECHMGRTKANVVDPRIARVAESQVNIHEVPGGHSLDQLHKALTVAMDSRREGDTLAIDVRMTNAGAGHAVPTGMPGRRVILEMRVLANGETLEETRTYGKFFLDADGRRITDDSRYFTKGVRLESDSRIQPDERRVETFRFPVPSTATAHVSAKLHYEHAPTGGRENLTRITFFSDRRIVESRAKGASE
jgi:hypothetical protein